MHEKPVCLRELASVQATPYLLELFRTIATFQPEQGVTDVPQLAPEHVHQPVLAAPDLEGITRGTLTGPPGREHFPTGEHGLRHLLAEEEGDG